MSQTRTRLELLLLLHLRPRPSASSLRSLTLLSASWPPAVRLEVPGLAAVVTGRVRPCFIAPFERACPCACCCAQRGVIAVLLRRSARCQLPVLVLLRDNIDKFVCRERLLGNTRRRIDCRKKRSV